MSSDSHRIYRGELLTFTSLINLVLATISQVDKSNLIHLISHKMINEDKVISIVAKALEVEKSSINLDTKSSDIPEWDSLGHLAILSKISEEIGDQYNESQELASSSSVREIFNCLNQSK